MQMFNASLERFKCQCDNVVLVFKPNAGTEVPDHLVNFVYERFKDKGVFKAPVNMAEDAFEAEKRKALLLYLGITLRERRVNYLAYQDALRKVGATITPDPYFERSLRWEKELREMLNQVAPIEEELSFLEMKQIKATQIKEEEVEPSFEKTGSKRTKKVESQMEA